MPAAFLTEGKTESKTSIMKRILAASQMTQLEEHARQHPGRELDMLSGYPDSSIMPPWVRWLQQYPPEGFTSVAPAVYEQRIRFWFSQYFGATHVRLAGSATQAFAMAAQAVTPYRGEWVLQEQSYDSWPLLLRRSGARVKYAPRGLDGMPSVQSVSDACTPHTCAVLIVCPDNPLGVVTSAERLAEIARVCRQRDIILVVDYSLAMVNPLGHSIPLLPRMTCSAGLQWAAIGDTGKFLGLGGSKLGALMCSPLLQNRVSAAASAWGYAHSQYTLAIISEILADTRLDVRHVSRQVAAHYAFLLDELDPDGQVRTGTAPPGLRISLEAGPFLLADAAGLGMSDVQYAALLRDKYSVLTVPLSWFPGAGASTRVRISLARSTEAVVRLAAALAGSAKEARAA